MSLQFSLELNPLTARPDDYMAVVRNPKSVEIKDVVKQITRPGSILKETECNAVINDFFNALSQNLQEGIGFSSPYLSISPGLSGVFDSNSEAFNPKKHSKTVNIHAGTHLREAVEQMKTERVVATAPMPEVKTLFDIKSQLNNCLSPGGMADITGYSLKIEGPDAGIFLISDQGAEIAIKYVHINEPRKLSFLVPAELKPGMYNLEVRSHVKGVKTLTTGQLKDKVKVG